MFILDPIFSILDPGLTRSRIRIHSKEFKYFLPKNWYFVDCSQKKDLGCSSQIWHLFHTGSKKHRIRIRNTALHITKMHHKALSVLSCRVGIKKPTQKNPPKKTQKTHLKKPTKNGFFWGFLGFFKFFIFYENNINFSVSNRFFMNK